jgi:hypothetical protein
LGIHYLLRFWDIEYACQPDVRGMFGDHYGSHLASSGALVDLKKELQSAYMGTKLYQFGLACNLLNNSKSEANQKKLRLQKLFQITPYFSTNFLGFFLTP